MARAQKYELILHQFTKQFDITGTHLFWFVHIDEGNIRWKIVNVVNAFT